MNRRALNNISIHCPAKMAESIKKKVKENGKKKLLAEQQQQQQEKKTNSVYNSRKREKYTKCNHSILNE